VLFCSFRQTIVAFVPGESSFFTVNLLERRDLVPKGIKAQLGRRKVGSEQRSRRAGAPRGSSSVAVDAGALGMVTVACSSTV
jgi:hypothetical protein